MIGTTYTTRLVILVAFVVALPAASYVHAVQPVVGFPRFVEVFTTIELPATSESAFKEQSDSKEMEFHVYELDGIQSTEAKLSEGLTADAERSKRVVLQRFQQLREEDRAQMQSAAMGLAKAMQYGVDRYPAIVFDGQAVVYGVTDVQIAIAHYRAWRQEGK